MIQLLNIHHSFAAANGAVEVFRGVSLDISPDDFVVVTGRSGEGKSTFLYILGGLLKPGEGRVLIDDTDIYALDDKRRARFRAEKFGFVFQNPSLLPSLSVLDNVLLPVALSGRRVTGRDLDKALDLLEQVGLKDKSGMPPAKLSGGQQRRVGIARALMLNPPYILADEPTADLDEDTENAALELFRQLNESGRTILLVTHATEHTAWGNRVLQVKQHQIREAVPSGNTVPGTPLPKLSSFNDGGG